MLNEILRLDAVGQADLIRRGEVSAIELVDASIAAIERLNPSLNAVIHPLFERARERATGALPDGPFRGVPFLFKDLDAPLAGAPFHAGMQILKDQQYVAAQDSFYAERVLAAGFVPVGKTNTPELGLAVTTEPRAYGPSRNPWNLEHSTGGSSGGAAAAVAARLVAVAHASDGGGSIRIPASECGLVGLKPSRGRVSLGPQYGEYWNGLVTNHVVSLSVRDTAQVLDTVCGVVPGDPYWPSPQVRPYREEVGAATGRLRAGILAAIPGSPDTLHPECAAAVSDAASLLEALGHDVETSHPAALDRRDEQFNGFFAIISAWIASALSEWGEAIGVEIGEGDVEPGTWSLAQVGATQPAGALVDQLKWAGRFTREMAQWWADGFDVLVTPTIALPPPKLGWFSGAPDDAGEEMTRLLSVIPFTPPFNLTGQPALSLPLHWTTEGLPVGVQFVAAAGREDVLIRLAAQLEEARPWMDRRPAQCAG